MASEPAVSAHYSDLGDTAGSGSASGSRPGNCAPAPRSAPGRPSPQADAAYGEYLTLSARARALGEPEIRRRRADALQQRLENLVVSAQKDGAGDSVTALLQALDKCRRRRRCALEDGKMAHRTRLRMRSIENAYLLDRGAPTEVRLLHAERDALLRSVFRIVSALNEQDAVSRAFDALLPLADDLCSLLRAFVEEYRRVTWARKGPAATPLIATAAAAEQNGDSTAEAQQCDTPLPVYDAPAVVEEEHGEHLCFSEDDFEPCISDEDDDYSFSPVHSDRLAAAEGREDDEDVKAELPAPQSHSTNNGDLRVYAARRRERMNTDGLTRLFGDALVPRAEPKSPPRTQRKSRRGRFGLLRRNRSAAPEPNSDGDDEHRTLHCAQEVLPAPMCSGKEGNTEQKATDSPQSLDEDDPYFEEIQSMRKMRINTVLNETVAREIEQVRNRSSSRSPVLGRVRSSLRSTRALPRFTMARMRIPANSKRLWKEVNEQYAEIVESAPCLVQKRVVTSKSIQTSILGEWPAKDRCLQGKVRAEALLLRAEKGAQDIKDVVKRQAEVVEGIRKEYREHREAIQKADKSIELFHIANLRRSQHSMLG